MNSRLLCSRFATLLVLAFSLVFARAADFVIISEFLAANDGGLRDEDGESSDWIEIYNAGSNTVNLAGWYLTDDAADLTKWSFPATNLHANDFLLVFASGKNRRAPGFPLHTSFNLNSAGEYLALVRPDGVTVAWHYSPTYPQQYDNYSYGMRQAVSVTRYIASNAPVRYFIPSDNSIGLTWTATNFNDVLWPAGTNGIGFESSAPGFAVKNFKANVTVSTLADAETVIADTTKQSWVSAENRNLVNYFNTGSQGNYPGDSTFPGLSMGADVDDFVVEATATITFPAPGVYTFGVNSDDGFRLTIGSFVNACDCLRGPGDTLATFTVAVPGDYPLRLVFFERGGGSEVELFAASGSYSAWNSTAFRLVGDTSAGGLAVRSTPVASGTTLRGSIRTDVQAQMANRSSAYVRIPFNVPNTNLASLTLEVKYDDGFIAYLNGTEVARRNAPSGAAFNSVATASRTNSAPLTAESIGLAPFVGLLRHGTNVLAIHALNDATNGTDFLIEAQLAEYRATMSTNFYFSRTSPGTFNSSGIIAFVADTKFSHDRGFYDTNFSLSITTATAGATIYYTTNGSVPAPGNGYVYSAPIPISGTVVVRAAAYRSAYQPSDVDTHSYIFVNDVVLQSTNAPTAEWPAPQPNSGPQIIDYGMDPEVVTNAPWAAEIRADLRSIPTFSIVTSLSNLFNPANGIYVNPEGAGFAWERPASLELINPDGSKGFHINCGLRLRGGFSRSRDNPKHAFRFFFRDEYGAGKLRFPLFKSQNGASEFDGFDLRTFQNYSWSFGGDGRGMFMRDVFSRDTQLAMGQHGERGDYFHLYVNGHYWGIYNSDERPEASYAATYYGGNADDYDVVKVDPQSGYVVVATDGNLDAWFRLWMASTNGFTTDTNYYAIQGLNPDGSVNPAYENLLDVPNLIDYMLVILWGGNLDAPISWFLGEQSPNNWYGSRSRLNTGGFRFFAHDSEHTLLNVNEDRTGPFPAGDPVTDGGFPKSNPQYIWQQLSANTEFRMLVADRVQKHFFNGGALSIEASRARFLQRSNELYRAVVCESARWGDSKTGANPPLTRNHWLGAIADVWNNFLPGRNGVLLSQLRNKGLFPTYNAPSFSTNGGIVPLGYSLTITNNNAAGTIYYTLDGSDPRLRGGEINPNAIAYSAPITVNTFKQVRARAKDGATWSALIEANFFPVQDYSGLLVTEIMYNPPDVGVVSGDEFEFLELKNTGVTTLDLSSAFFSGITFTFTNNTHLAPGQFFVLGRNAAQLQSKYPGIAVNGIFTGKLDNSGEKLTLTHALGAEILSLTYNDNAPWPVAPDGNGFSLVPRSANSNPDMSEAINWRASSAIGGSPGADDPAVSFAPIVINEILTHTLAPTVDAIELYNPANTNVDVSGWFLSDDSTVPKKFRIPNGTVIPANGYIYFTETNFNSTPGSNTSFSLDSFGEEVYLLSGNASTNLTGYSYGFAFGAAELGVSFGRYINSVGEELFPAQIANTFAATNSRPRVGPIVINEIQYHPTAGYDEFVELLNITSTNVPLFDPAAPTNTWKLDGLGYTFATNLTLAPNSFILLVPTNPAVFRAKYSVPAEVQIVGPYSGLLQDSGEKLELKRPGPRTTNGVPYIVVDDVRYNDKLPWPVSADGAGPSLQRRIASAFGNDPTNWFASGISAGRSNFFNASPNVALTAPAANTYFVPPTNVAVSASASDSDGVVTKVEFYANGLFIGQDSNAPYSFTWTNAPAGTYALTARAYDNNFALTISAANTVFILTPTPVTLIATGSVWKYLDNGSNQGTNWVTRTFIDSSWASGPAELGYGDSSDGRPEATVVSYGPNAAAKYPTTYFRRSFVVNDPSAYVGLRLNVLRDDGAIAYLNGVEVFRNNMAPSGVTYLSYASAACSDDGAVFFPTNVNPSLLVAGTNVLAVEIHQSSAGSTDLSFELSLIGSNVVVPPVITLQPTNQTVAPGSNVTFVAAASGSAPLSLQWRLNGTNLPNATNATLARTNVTTNDAGPYMFVAANSAGSATSQVAILTVGMVDADQDGLPDDWERAHQLDPGNSNDANWDHDEDGMSNLHEYRSGTNPTNAASVLRVQWISIAPAKLQFIAQSNIAYSVNYQTGMAAPWLMLTNVSPQSLVRTMQVVDPNGVTNRQRYYRVTVTN